jgi:chromosome segregation ATPase
VVALPVAPLIESLRSRTDGTEGELGAARTRVADAEAEAQVAQEAVEAERARVSEQAASLASLEVERDAALHARDAAVAEAEALRAEREQAIRLRDAAQAEAETATAERDRAADDLRQWETGRETLIHEHESSQVRETEAQRSREVALAEAVALGESLARAEALAAELARDRDAALAARDEAASELAEIRLALDEARLANVAQEGQIVRARTDGARLAGKLQSMERTAGVSGLNARLEELETEVEAEKTNAFELRAELDRTQAAAAIREQELEAVRTALRAAEEQNAKLDGALGDGRGGALESDAALQAARSEAQAARTALEVALDRATRAEQRASELEEALEKGVPVAVPTGTEAQELEEMRARVQDLVGTAERLAATEGLVETLQGELERLREEKGVVAAVAASDLEGLRVQTEEAEDLAVQLAEAAAMREAIEKKLAQVKESSDRKVAEARRAAYEAAAKAEAARQDAEAMRKQLQEGGAGAGGEAGAAEPSGEWAQVREALEAQVAELNARLEAEAERTTILSAQAAEARAQLEGISEREATPGAEERIRDAEARADDFARRVVAAEARGRELDVAALGGGGEAAPSADVEVLRAELAELKSARSALEKELAEARSTADTAEAQAAEIAAEMQAVRWEKEEVEQRLQSGQGGAPPAPGDSGRLLRDELATRMAELALTKREVERLEAVVASLSVRTEIPPSEGVAELEQRLAEALQRAADAEAALGASRAEVSSGQGDAVRRISHDRDAIAAQVAERDGKISRLQREVADKTERLGRLAKELGELKAKGLGKIFR